MYKNVPEEMFARCMELMNWEVTKRGWPDFFCWHPDGKFAMVEVKDTAKHPLKKEQKRTMEYLSQRGIPCYVWNLEEGKLTSYIPTGKLNQGNRRTAQKNP